MIAISKFTFDEREIFSYGFAYSRTYVNAANKAQIETNEF